MNPRPDAGFGREELPKSFQLRTSANEATELAGFGVSLFVGVGPVLSCKHGGTENTACTVHQSDPRSLLCWSIGDLLFFNSCGPLVCPGFQPRTTFNV